jgi:hypothetical protein
MGKLSIKNILKFNNILILLLLSTPLSGCSNSSSQDTSLPKIKLSRILSEEISLSDCKWTNPFLQCILLSPYRSYDSSSFGYYVYSKNGVLIHSGDWPLTQHMPKGVKTRVDILPGYSNRDNWGYIILRATSP